AADIVPQILKPLLRKTLAEVDGKHPPPGSSSERRMLGVMIKADDIAWLSLQGYRRNLPAGKTELFLGLARLPLQPLRIFILDQVTAGNDSQTASVPCDRIEIEGNLDMPDLGVPAVGVPAGVSDIVVAVAAHIVEVFPEQAVGDS